MSDTPPPCGHAECETLDECLHSPFPPRFTPERIEELLRAGNDLSEGELIPYQDAVDLVEFWRDEFDRIRNAYQERLGDIAQLAADLALKAAKAYPCP